MLIRHYTDTDFPTVVEIYEKSKLDELQFENRSFTLLPLQKDTRRLERLLACDIHLCIDTRDNSTVGYGARIGSEIRGLIVHPGARGRGAGEKLLQHLLDEIDGPTTLCVAKSNAIAKALYKKYDFVEVQEFRSSYNGVAVVVNEMVRQ